MKKNSYWKIAEQMNGRLAMMGLFAAVVNYGFTGWIIPGFFQGDLDEISITIYNSNRGKTHDSRSRKI